MNRSDKIESKNIQDILALTPMQEGMLFHYLQAPHEDSYFNQLDLEISGNINPRYLEEAWNFVLETNEMLRTVFRWEKLEKPSQVVLKRYTIYPRYEDLSSLEDGVEQKKQWEHIKQKDRNNGFDLRQVPFRVILGKMSQNRHQMIISSHHILYDGWSTGIILKEFFRAYEALAKGNQPLFPIAKSGFKEFIQWHREQDREVQRKFWQNYLEGFDTPARLPIKQWQKNPGSPVGGNYQFHLCRTVRDQLEVFVTDQRITLAAVFYGTWGLLLQKYCNLEDVVFGTTVSGRSVPIRGIEDMVGLFINTLPLRVTSQGSKSLTDLLAKVNQDLLYREKYENTPLVDIHRYCRRETGQELFDSLMIIENYPLDHFLKEKNKALPLTIHSYSSVEANPYDLNIVVTLHDRIDIRLIYDDEGFAENAIARLSRHFICILTEIMTHPYSPTHAIDILSPGEKKQLLQEFNDTGPGFPTDKTLHGLFAEQAGRTPDGVALVGSKLQIPNHKLQTNSKSQVTSYKQSGALRADLFDACGDVVSITYTELNKISSALAWILQEIGMNQGELVAIMVERSIEMILGILGILKAGCAYVPLDPQAPPERIHYQLTDSRAKVLVSTGVLAAKVDVEILRGGEYGNFTKEGERLKRLESKRDFEIVYLETLSSPLLLASDPDCQMSPPLNFPLLQATGNRQPATSLAYIIYTSGSTGIPKGVPVLHANFSPLVHWGYRHLGIGPADRSVQNLSYYFDWSVWEIFFALTSGASLYMVPGEVVPDAERYLDFIHLHAITVLHITPTHFQSLLHISPGQRLNTLRYLCIGAEKLNCHLVERSYTWIHEECRVFNMYGPTEATIMAAVLEIDKAEFPGYKEFSSVPIGKNLGNNILLIMDRHLHLCPLFVPGELVIGGDGVAPGYLNQPELTGEKFIFYRPHRSHISYRSYMTYTPKKLYKTGDLARWYPDGNIEFLGRMDFQVKVRGFRIELGEIESRLSNHPWVKESVVTVQTYGSGDHFLCAYVVPYLDKSFEISRLKDYLRQTLPGYMIPDYFVIMDGMPFTSSGKIDRYALPPPEVKSTKEYVPSANEVEARLVHIWSGLLGIEGGQIGIDDNFFELGGHSLKITALRGRIYKEMSIEVPFAVVFNGPTVRELARYISRKEKSRGDEHDIPLTEEKEYYSLSPAQNRLYVLQQMDTASLVYHLQGILVLEGEVDKTKIAEVFRDLIRRHESLRTSFHMVKDEPVQRIRKVPCGRDLNDFHEYLTTEVTEGLSKVFGSPEPFFQKGFWPPEATIRNFIRPFDLSRAPLLRVGLIELERHRHLLMMDMHHIISDGYSLGILIREFMSLYHGENLPVLHLRYRDFSQCYNGRRGEDALLVQERYWLKELEGDIPVLNLPIDFTRPVVQDFSGAQTGFWVGKEETAALQAIVLGENTTLFSLLFSVFTIFLSRLSGQEDIIVGTPVIGRKQHDLAGVIGMFVNMLALRNFPVGDRTFPEFLRETGARIVGALENQEYPFEELVKRLNLNRDASRNPLFDTAFALQDPDMPQLEIPGLKVIPHEYDPGTAKFDLTLIAELVGHRLHFTFQYCTKLFKAGTIDGFSEYFQQLLSSITENPGQKIAALNMLSRQEKEKLIFEFNDIEAYYPNDKTIPGLFLEQVKKTPDQAALVGASGGQGAFLKNRPLDPQKTFYCLTYSELNNRSDQLANVLMEKGVLPDTIVGIMMERSVEMIIGILGILKAGGAYLPIDPEYPVERIDYMLKDSRVKWVVTAHNIERVIDGTYLSYRTHMSYKAIKKPAAVHLPSATSLAYVIYTSGSTGKPKGVPIAHRNFSPLLHWGYRHLGIGPNDRALQNLSYFFDWSVWEIFITLTTGASLYMVTREVIMDPGKCIEFICRHALTVLHITPTHYSYLVNTGKVIETLRYLFIGAEKLTYDLVKRSMAAVGATCRIFNMYGPTEATIISGVLEIDRSRIEEYKELSSVPIGKPPGNIYLLVLDHYLNLCPVKAAGELYIGGDAVAMGYLNNPELTQLVFKQKLLRGVQGGGFLEKSPPGRRGQGAYKSNILYRTGDVARWLGDGNVEYLGRVDFQVKIRGYRIELGEIEKHLLDFPGIREAVVLVRENQGREKYLCAYIVTDENIDQTKLKITLAGILPDYMIPSYFIRLEQMPLNPNKKVDLKALPGPVLTGGEDYTAPANEIEKKLVDIWSEILGIEKELIGVDADFFRLGGHSLKATLLATRIEKELRVKVPLAEIFITPTIRGLAEFITHGAEFKFQSIEPVEKKKYYPLSSAQKRLFILQQMDEQGIGYNISSIWKVEGHLDLEKMERAFQCLVRRHESLRTSFMVLNEEPVQRIHDEADFKIENDTLQNTNHKKVTSGQWPVASEKKTTSEIGSSYRQPVTGKRQPGTLIRNTNTIIKDFIRPFDLSNAPLFRVGILEQEKQKNILLVDMHHIISDGVSSEVLVQDFSALYSGNELPGIKLRYQDYAQWHHRERVSKKIQGQGEYWKKLYDGEIPVLNLKTDYARPAVQTFEGSSIKFEVDSEMYNALQALALERGATLYILLLAVYTILLSKLTGREDIVIGTPVAGRRHADLERIIGMFVNTLALRNYPSGEKKFTDFLAEIKERTLKAFENQEYQYEDLVENLALTRDGSRNPLFDTMFALQNTGGLAIDIPGLKLVPYEYDRETSIFDLSLTVEVEEKLDLIFEYNTGLFKPETIERFVDYFKQIISSILNNREIKIDEIEIRHRYTEIETNVFSTDLMDFESIFPGK